MPSTKASHPIGVFDSGFGGITILRGIVKALPQYDYLYLGDTARTPYGTRSPEVIYEFTRQAVDFLFSQGCPLIILACNTASAEALRKIQQEYLPKKYPGKRVLGVLIPAAQDAVRVTNGRVGVIATSGTVASEAFVHELKKLDPSLSIYQQACPLLVPLVEEGEERSEVAHLLLKKYLAPLQKKKIDTLVLGCTHYGVLERAIKKIVGAGVHVVSEEKSVPKKLGGYLTDHSALEKKISRGATVRFTTTDLTEKFQLLGSRFFGSPIAAEKINLQ